ncbi:Hypothetical predicted protein [Marmota monax]|uniref:Uncharacterized protein n=1 Tax=Marmota monax TaxID=9995 RepID=A0A5E4AEM0_MARMO|nr:Hypothetical predicted protein [Marmota monax]
MDWVNYTSAFRAATPEVVFPWPPLCCRRTGNFIPVNENGCRLGHVDYLFTKVCPYLPSGQIPAERGSTSLAAGRTSLSALTPSLGGQCLWVRGEQKGLLDFQPSTIPQLPQHKISLLPGTDSAVSPWVGSCRPCWNQYSPNPVWGAMESSERPFPAADLTYPQDPGSPILLVRPASGDPAVGDQRMFRP